MKGFVKRLVAVAVMVVALPLAGQVIITPGGKVGITGGPFSLGCILKAATGTTASCSLLTDVAGLLTYAGDSGIFAPTSLIQGGNLATVPLGTPTITSVTPTCVGTCATTYGYKVSALLGDGSSTQASAEVTTAAQAATLDATHYNTVTWGAVLYAVSYDVWRTTGGAAPPDRIANVVAPIVTYRDNADFGGGGTPPTTNTTGIVTGAVTALRSATTSVDVSAATVPSNGQVLTATGSTAATWQTPSAASAPFSDATALVKNAADATKLVAIDASGITTGNTVTMAVSGTATAPTVTVGGMPLAFTPVSLGAELAVNGTFTGSAASWTLGAAWRYGTNNVEKYQDGTTTLSQTATGYLTAGMFYQVSFTISAWTAGTVTLSFAGYSVGPPVGADGTYTYNVPLGLNAYTVGLTTSNTARMFIDDFSIRLLSGGSVMANPRLEGKELVLLAPGEGDASYRAVKLDTLGTYASIPTLWIRTGSGDDDVIVKAASWLAKTTVSAGATESILNTNGFGAASTSSFAWSSTGYGSDTKDTILTRAAAATVRMGAADAAAPVAQTLKVQGVVAGTADTAGTAWVRAGSVSTGGGAGGAIVERTAMPGAASTVQNALTTRRYTPSGWTTVPDTTATTIGTIAYGAGSSASVEFLVTLNAYDATNVQTMTSRVRVSSARNIAGGSTVSTVGVVGTDLFAGSAGSGSLACTFSVVDGATSAALQASCVSSLTETLMRATWQADANGGDGLTGITLSQP